ncbi:hypothetical protein [Metapseudomonas otitidis]|uniref:hypothetical protein n=1 Tax=Metapseudomonas otitidis TaxID=319939 RepID=UPI0013F5D258|nr:hypothetical protein [Pseudomonas otitidis]
MNGLFFTITVLFAVVGILWYRHGPVKSKKRTPRQEPSLDRREPLEDYLHVSPAMAARAQAAKSPLIPCAVPVMRGATRVNVLPPPMDYSMYEEPAFQRLGVQLSFA